MICAVWVCFFARLFQQFVIALIARLGFGLAGFRRGRDPFLLAGQRLLMSSVLAALLLEPLLLLLQPGRVIALVGDALAAIELEDPTRDVVEEVAIMGDDQDRAGIVAQMPFQPRHGFCVEMVGRFVEQQEFGLVEQQLAQRDAAALAAGEFRDLGIVGRAAQRVHGLVDLAVEIPEALSLDLVLQLGHLVRGLLGIIHRQLIVAIEDGLLLGDAQHDVLAHAECRIEMRLLFEIADAGALGDPGLAVVLLVEAGHDLEQRRLARAVDTEDADLGVRVERQMDVIEHLAGRVALGQALHKVDELARHRSRKPSI
ncbi:hypothetical protein ACVWW2_006903 [Bradyrhizobium sp. LM4.3]